MTNEFSHNGATTNVAERVKTHFFLICPNNSGSTFFIRALAHSRHVWSLRREGQHVFGYFGPHTANSEYPLIWGSRQEWVDLFRNDENYNWNKTKRSWYFQARAHDDAATIFATKAPPFLLITKMLAQNFANTKFAFMVRDPYATIEGICRNKAGNNVSSDAMVQIAARHLITCFRYQKSNIEEFADRSVFFTYEDFCANPKTCQDKVTSLLPQIDDLDFNQKIAVKGNYDEPLRNMNAQQISRLTKSDFDQINAVLEKEAALFEHFGYQLRDG